MYSIDKINPMELSFDDLEKLYKANIKATHKYNQLERFRDMEEYKNLYLLNFNNEDAELFILKNSQEVCGILSFVKTFDWGGNLQYKLTISLSDSAISEELIHSLNLLIQDKITKHNKIAVVTYNDELAMLIKMYRHKVNIRGNYYTLKKDDIDLEMLNNYIATCELKNKDLTIKYTDLITEEYIQQYCDLFMETSEDMTDNNEEGFVPYIITPEMQRKNNESFKARNITHNCYMIFNEENKMIAKSNVSVNNNDPRFPYQFMIGVKKTYRGRHLGKWLYASMYKRLYENVNFEKVLVCHHPENIPAINVSKWVGYKFNYLETIHILEN